MRKLIPMLIIGALPAFAVASGDHDHGHEMQGGGHAMEHQHGAHSMNEGHEGAAGGPGVPADATRTIEVTMNDTMRFVPAKMDFKKGETVRFVVRNNGKIRHEMVIGTVAEIQEHAAMMRDNPGMQHAESNMISLAPGQSGEIVWKFDKSGDFDFACLIPGHLEAGMTGKIHVE